MTPSAPALVSTIARSIGVDLGVEPFPMSAEQIDPVIRAGRDELRCLVDDVTGAILFTQVG